MEARGWKVMIGSDVSERCCVHAATDTLAAHSAALELWMKKRICAFDLSLHQTRAGIARETGQAHNGSRKTVVAQLWRQHRMQGQTAVYAGVRLQRACLDRASATALCL